MHASGKRLVASPTGNRTPVSRVTGGDTHHYTIEDWLGEGPSFHRAKVNSNLLRLTHRSSQGVRGVFTVQPRVGTENEDFPGEGIARRVAFHPVFKTPKPAHFSLFCGNLGFGCHEISLQFAFVFTALKRASRGPLIIRGREGGRGANSLP